MPSVGAMLYSPTSPAGSEGSPPSPVGDNQDTATAEAAGRLDTTEAVQLPSAALAGPCPTLCIGPRFDKEYTLNPNRWVKIGRSKKAQLLLSNAGVSRNHCSIRWDRHRRAVELKDTSTGGTMVNGDLIKSGRHTLAHADRVRIEGKGAHYDFLLDLRPVGLGWADPREEQKGRQLLWKKLKGPALLQRRDALRAQLAKLDADIQRCEKEAFEKEREFHQIAMRRNLRLQEDKQRKEHFDKYTAGKKVLEELLKEGRENWLAKLKAESEANELEVKPLLELVAERQVKVEKLQLKKDELERTIHPERYAVADVSRVGSFLPTPEKTPSVEARSQEHSEPLALDDIEAEKDTFADLMSGIPGQREPQQAKLVAAGQLESSSADEPEAKRPKVESRAT